tara:strand:- start:361 stop:654 length:294 start_codon:yes stop_codon:yes gene_type:complete
MALEKESVAFSTEFKNAYYQIAQCIYSISAVNGDKPNTQVNVVVWANKESRESDDDKPIHQFTEYFNLDISKANQNPVKKGYEYLKTLESMADAKDV